MIQPRGYVTPAMAQLLSQIPKLPVVADMGANFIPRQDAGYT